MEKDDSETLHNYIDIVERQTSIELIHTLLSRITKETPLSKIHETIERCILDIDEFIL